LTFKVFFNVEYISMNSQVLTNDTKINTVPKSIFKFDSEMSFNQQFENAIQQAWKVNINRVKEIARAVYNNAPATEFPQFTPTQFVKECRDLSTKIDNACERTGGIICRVQTLMSIMKDDVVAYSFAKDPLKQNFAELFQHDYLRDMKGKHAIIKMSGGGKKAHYLIDGNDVTGLSKKPSGSNSTKSIDFQCDNEYYYAKHTSADGGAQDNQCDDGKRFIEQANIYVSQHNDDKVFILLVDGAYYNDDRKNKIRAMIAPEHHHRVRVCGCDEV